jgi:hypothetical protein
MKVKDANRIGITVPHLQYFEEALQDLADPKPSSGCRYKCLQLSVMSICDSGGNGTSSDIEIDCETAAKILPRIKEMIVEEMKAIGAEIEE